MHNNFGNIMSNAAYSVTSLIFYPYHSWIDAMVEIKLRRGNNPKVKSDYDYFVKVLDN